MFEFSERNREITERLNIQSTTDISREVTDILSEIELHEKKISQSIHNNQNILKSLHEKNENLSECVVLLNRYDELKTQYNADLKRLSFIVDGEVNLNENFNSQCPFCDGKVSIKTTPNYTGVAKSDYKKIKLQIKDLEKAENALLKEKESIEQSVTGLMSEKQATESLIKTELQPQIANLKAKLEQYKIFIELQNEMAVIKKIADSKVTDIIDVESNEENNIKFKVKEHLTYDFISTISDELKNLLQACKFENITSVRFDKSSMDMVINGKKKSSNGKGYNAFLNSIMSIVLLRYLHSQGKFSPNLLVLDSPILSLKEKGERKPC